MQARWRVRQVVNVLNLSTPLGLLVAVSGRCRFSRGPDGLVLAKGCRWRWRASALTIGNVVILRLDDEALARRPHLLAHEARHATQYACCIGPVMLPLYLLASAWSLLVARNPATRNLFEVRAGLLDGGYLRDEPPGGDGLA